MPASVQILIVGSAMMVAALMLAAIAQTIEEHGA
jgi:hypothetical protein